MHELDGANSELPREQSSAGDGANTEPIEFYFVNDGSEQDGADRSACMAAFDLPIGSDTDNPMTETAEPANGSTDITGETPESEADDTVAFVVSPHALPYDTAGWRDILATGYEQSQDEFVGDSARAAELLAAFDAGVDETHRYIAATQPEGWKDFEKPTIGIVTDPDFMHNIAFTDGASPVVYVGGRYLGRMTRLDIDVDQVMTDMDSNQVRT